MHRLWCKATVQMLKAITETEGLMKFKHAEKRAHIAKISNRKAQSPANQEGNPTTNRCRRMSKLAARLRELQNQLITNDKYIAEGEHVSEDAERQRQQLWLNIIKEVVEDLHLCPKARGRNMEAHQNATNENGGKMHKWRRKGRRKPRKKMARREGKLPKKECKKTCEMEVRQPIKQSKVHWEPQGSMSNQRIQ